MNQIIAGAAAGILGDKTGEALYGKSHLDEHGECVHMDLHRILECLERILEHPRTRPPVFDRITLQPGILIPMDKLDRDYSVALVAASTPIQFEIIGLGQAFSLTLAAGWNILNMPDGTRWGLPSNAANSVGVVYCATDDIFGNSI